MELLLGAALALLSAAVVAYPFWRRLGVSAEETEQTETTPQESQLEGVYQAIETLRLDYQLGRMPEHVYQELLRDYRRQAAALLRDVAQGQGQTDEWTLEAEVKLARATLRNQSQAVRCPECGAAADIAAMRCPGCGSDLLAATGGRQW